MSKQAKRKVARILVALGKEIQQAVRNGSSSSGASVACDVFRRKVVVTKRLLRDVVCFGHEGGIKGGGGKRRFWDRRSIGDLVGKRGEERIIFKIQSVGWN
jgi:hypothetical protein